MLRRCSIAVVAICLICLAIPSTWSAASSAERPRARKTSYTVLSRSGGVIRIAAVEWIPHRAKTVVIAIHGGGGMKENNWGPLVVPGYSFALDQYDRGRATIAIDLPGYGESGGNPYVTTIDDHAFVVDQIVDDVRRRFDHVVGLGHSLGGGVVSTAQALFGSFDAIVPAAGSHGGGPPEGACDPAQGISKVLFTSYADPRVVEDFVWRLRPPKVTAALAITPFAAGDGVLTRTIAVPVLVILGEHDCQFDTSKYGEESSYYSSSPDVKVFVVPRAGHAVFHHLNRGDVFTTIGSWLTKQKL